MISGGTILAVFFMMILWTLHTAALEEPAIMFGEDEVPPVPLPLTGNSKFQPPARADHADPGNTAAKPPGGRGDDPDEDQELLTT
jgi:hypothetical protein